jgi:hypothetical protein
VFLCFQSSVAAPRFVETVRELRNLTAGNSPSMPGVLPHIYSARKARPDTVAPSIHVLSSASSPCSIEAGTEKPTSVTYRLVDNSRSFLSGLGVLSSGLFQPGFETRFAKSGAFTGDQRALTNLRARI